VKSYIITLLDYPQSMAMARQAWMSGQKLGWDLDFWPGIDGTKVSIIDMANQYNLRACDLNKKCLTLMQQRAGVRGCFLSHWSLWNHCLEANETIAIFEHDVLFNQPPPSGVKFRHVLKMEGFDEKPARPAGAWYEGARAYLLKPAGARRLLAWSRMHGCLPADVAIGKDVVDITLLDQGMISLQVLHDTKASKHINSFTWNLEGMQRQ